MIIRDEQPSDIDAIRDITTAAFATMPYSSQTEAAIVDALRAARALTVSLVAESDGEIVGHIAFSPVTIDGQDIGWFGLGPVSIRPDQQQKGIGSTLIRDGLKRLQGINAAGCVLMGDPAYYRRFGFENDPALRYNDELAQYFMRLVLAGPPAAGQVAFHPGFDAV